MMILLGEIGGVQEILVASAVRNKQITKPVVAWCIGTAQQHFGSDIQFGHAGASATEEYESAIYKNECMRQAGVVVPQTFEDLANEVERISKEVGCHKTNISDEQMNIKPKTFNLNRKKATFFCSISNENKSELEYNKTKISEILKQDSSLGKTIGHLWLKKDLPS